MSDTASPDALIGLLLDSFTVQRSGGMLSCWRCCDILEMPTTVASMACLVYDMILTMDQEVSQYHCQDFRCFFLTLA